MSYTMYDIQYAYKDIDIVRGYHGNALFTNNDDVIISQRNRKLQIYSFHLKPELHELRMVRKIW